MQATAGGGAGSGAPCDEVKRIRSALDSRYTTADVVYTFESYFGEAVDCIDYYRHPGIKAQIAEGRAVPDPRSKARDTISRSALPDFMFNGKPDRLGRSRACPEGSVPMLRLTLDDVLAAGGLDAVRSHARKRPPPRDEPLDPCPGDPETYAHIVKNFNGSSITSGISNMAIYAPAIDVNRLQVHSLAQTWTSTGSGLNICNQTCAPADCYQTVEAGWTVDPLLFRNNNPAAPHLFTFATTDGYATGCYNQDPT